MIGRVRHFDANSPGFAPALALAGKRRLAHDSVNSGDHPANVG
jgi:hypothetical protein